MALNIRHGVKSGGTSWPDASSTGTSGALTAVPGSVTSGTGWSWNGSEVEITGSSLTFQNYDVSGQITVTGNSVTVSNCRISNTASAGVYTTGNSTTVVDCDILGDGTNTSAGMNGVWIETGTGAIVRRCDISGVENGIMLSGTGALIEDNYIHDLLDEITAPSAHTDGIQLFGGGAANGATIQRNAIYSVHTNATSALIMGDNTNVTITGNRWRGGYAVFRIWGAASNSYTNNRIGDLSEVGGAALTDLNGGTSGVCTWSGNVNDDTGATLSTP